MKTLETPQQVILSRIDHIAKDKRLPLMERLQRCAKLRAKKQEFDEHERN